MATIVSPGSHAQTESTVGFSYVFTGNKIRQEITEQLNVLGMGLVSLEGELTGQGSDTLRVTRFGALGFAETMTAMTTETQAITPTGYTINSDSITIGRYGLAKEQTYQDQMLQRAEAVGLAQMGALAPQSWLATMRDALCTVGASFASGAGTSGSAWDYDEELELIALFHETEGFDPAVHFPVTVRHPEQYTDFRNAIRNEPGLQNDASLQQALLGLAGKEAGGAFNFLGLRNFASHDVDASGGDHVGFAYVPGAIAWVTASTLPIAVANPATTVFIPEFGIVIEYKSTGSIATAAFDMNAWFGLAKLSATIAPQFKITSVND
jgi:hypothetical protein